MFYFPQIHGIFTPDDVVYAPNDYNFLYNWWAVNDARSLTPDGWRVATVSDWNELLHSIYYDPPGFLYGAKLKESGTTRWNSPNTGAVNEYGMQLLPGGWRLPNGTFNLLGQWGRYWASDGDTINDGVGYDFLYNSIYAYGNDADKDEGRSIRCVSDDVLNWDPDNTVMTDASGQVYPTVRIEGYSFPPKLWTTINLRTTQFADGSTIEYTGTDYGGPLDAYWGTNNPQFTYYPGT